MRKLQYNLPRFHSAHGTAVLKYRRPCSPLIRSPDPRTAAGAWMSMDDQNLENLKNPVMAVKKEVYTNSPRARAQHVLAPRAERGFSSYKAHLVSLSSSERRAKPHMRLFHPRQGLITGLGTKKHPGPSTQRQGMLKNAVIPLKSFLIQQHREDALLLAAALADPSVDHWVSRPSAVQAGTVSSVYTTKLTCWTAVMVASFSGLVEMILCWHWCHDGHNRALWAP